MPHPGFKDGWNAVMQAAGLTKEAQFDDMDFPLILGGGAAGRASSLPWETQMMRGTLATLPLASLYGAPSNIAAAKKKYQELGLDESKLSLPTRHPWLTMGANVLGGAGLGGAIGGLKGGPGGGLLGAGIGGLLGGAVLGPGSLASLAYDDLSRADAVAAEQTRKDQQVNMEEMRQAMQEMLMMQRMQQGGGQY